MEDRVTNNNNIDKTPYDGVLFRNGSPLMEVEVNEMQDIMQYKLQQLCSIIGNCVVGFNEVQQNDGSYTLPDNSMVICNGSVINMSGITFNIDGDIDAIYLHIKDDIIYTPDDIITAHGAVNNVAGSIIQDPITVENKILDDRIKKETSYRKGFKWWFSTDDADGAVPIFKASGGKLSTHDTMNTINTFTSKFADMNTKMTELGKSVSDGKSAIASAITNLGVSTQPDATFDDIVGSIGDIKDKYTSEIQDELNKVGITVGDGESLSDAINKIGNITPNVSDSSDGGHHTNATVGNNTVRIDYNDGTGAVAGDVLTGKKFASSAAGRNIAGTMPNHGAVTQSLGIGGSYTIPAGYHNGNGKVTVNITDQGAKTLTLNGSTVRSAAIVAGYHNGSGKAQCGCTDRGAWGGTINPGGSVIIPAGYHNGTGVVRANAGGAHELKQTLNNISFNIANVQYFDWYEQQYSGEVSYATIITGFRPKFVRGTFDIGNGYGYAFDIVTNPDDKIYIIVFGGRSYASPPAFSTNSDNAQIILDNGFNLFIYASGYTLKTITFYAVG